MLSQVGTRRSRQRCRVASFCRGYGRRASSRTLVEEAAKEPERALVRETNEHRTIEREVKVLAGRLWHEQARMTGGSVSRRRQSGRSHDAERVGRAPGHVL